jgi:hypothetical protein
LIYVSSHYQQHRVAIGDMEGKKSGSLKTSYALWKSCLLHCFAFKATVVIFSGSRA